MAGLDRQRRSKKYPHFIMLTYDLFDSEAWRSLRPISRDIWLMLVRRYNGKNNSRILLSCREVADKYRVSKDTASIGFKELIDRGFIIIAEEANFDMRSGRRSRRWTLTHVPLDGLRKGTNEWKKYKSPSD